MRKRVVFLVNSTPDKPALGFGDYVKVMTDTDCIYGGHASTCPNPYRVNGQGLPMPWTLLYGWIANGTYKYKCVKHHKYGICLLINGGGVVPSRTPNPNHDNQRIMRELFVHRPNIGGKNPHWRGSRGCPTVPEWDRFIACFEIGDTGPLVVENLIEGRG
jgi:hypothetical protein